MLCVHPWFLRSRHQAWAWLQQGHCDEWHLSGVGCIFSHRDQPQCEKPFCLFFRVLWPFLTLSGGQLLGVPVSTSTALVINLCPVGEPHGAKIKGEVKGIWERARGALLSGRGSVLHSEWHYGPHLPPSHLLLQPAWPWAIWKMWLTRKATTSEGSRFSPCAYYRYI